MLAGFRAFVDPECLGHSLLYFQYCSQALQLSSSQNDAKHLEIHPSEPEKAQKFSSNRCRPQRRTELNQRQDSGKEGYSHRDRDRLETSKSCNHCSKHEVRQQPQRHSPQIDGIMGCLHVHQSQTGLTQPTDQAQSGQAVWVSDIFASKEGEGCWLRA